MLPYATFLWFGVALTVILPTVALGIAGRLSARWIIATTLLMAAVQYGGLLEQNLLPDSSAAAMAGAGRELAFATALTVLSWGVASAFLRVRRRTERRWPFPAALALSLLPLASVKFLPFVASSAGSLSVPGFLGISYITFRSLDVVFGIQDRLVTTVPLGRYVAFLFFFPTLSSGPIDRYRRFLADVDRPRSREDYVRDLDGAVHHVFRGLLYKFVLAVLIQSFWLDPAGRGAGPLSLLSYMYAYSLYLFFDFAGYSAFAIGFSYLFGVHTPENFNRPFLAGNIAEFWNRWHISLSSWFRDHVYMRFVLAARRRGWIADRHLASYAGFFLTFGLMGLWHGTEPHYLVYGLYHGTLLTAHAAIVRWRSARYGRSAGPVWRAAGLIATFNLVCFGLLIFSGRLF